MKSAAVRSVLVLVIVAVPALAWTSPRAVICLASSFVGEKISEDGSIRASKSIGNTDSILFSEYVAGGRTRIENKLWATKSFPKILFLDGEKVFGLFDYNKYGSSIALPYKTCLLIGPEGTNVDIVSHELVHADIAEMLGYWNNLHFPAWLNEGVAMQVDTRKRYDSHVLSGIDPRYVTSKNGNEFYTGDVNDVVRNYAAAKYLVREWIEVNGVDRLLSKLLSKKPDYLLFPEES